MDQLATIDKNIAAVFQDELKEGEQILWCGQPIWNLSQLEEVTALCIAGVILISLVSGILWACIFIEGWLHDPQQHLDWGILRELLMVDLFAALICGRPLYDKWIKRVTFYAVTGRRIMIIRTKPIRTVDSISLRDLPGMRKEMSSEAGSNIIFSDQPADKTKKLSIFLPTLSVPAFLGIDGADSVIHLIDEQRTGVVENRQAS